MLTDFIEAVQIICHKHNCSVSSWIRTDKRNRMVGGSPNSQHLLGLAMDLIPDDWDDADDIVFDCHRLGLIAVVERNRNHIHVQALSRSTP